MPKSVTRTLRVDEELDRAVSKRAAKEQVSVNFLVNRCLRKFIEWDVPILELGMAVVPNVLLDRLSEGRDEQAFSEYGRQVARELLKPASQYIKGEFSVASSVEVLRRSSLYSMRFSFDFVDGHDSRNQVIVIRHDQGRPWSSFYAGLLDETFGVLLGEDVKTEYTDSLCIAQMTLVTRSSGR